MFWYKRILNAIRNNSFTGLDFQDAYRWYTSAQQEISGFDRDIFSIPMDATLMELDRDLSEAIAGNFPQVAMDIFNEMQRYARLVAEAHPELAIYVRDLEPDRQE